MKEMLEVLEIVAQRLESAGFAYMVSGSTAMNFYAQPRMTRDIDLVVELNARDAKKLTELFQDDFECDEEALKEAILHQKVFNLIHFDTIVKVDLIIRKNSPYRQLEFSRRRTVKLHNKKVSIVSPEDLVLSKLAWSKDSGSELQLRDIKNIIGSVPDLDWVYVEHWAKELDVETKLREVRP